MIRVTQGNLISNCQETFNSTVRKISGQKNKAALLLLEFMVITTCDHKWILLSNQFSKPIKQHGDAQNSRTNISNDVH